MSRRRNSQGEMCEVVKYTNTCSGCSCDVMEFDEKHGIPLGMGCHECGYKGKRRWVMYIPLPVIGPSKTQRGDTE